MTLAARQLPHESEDPRNALLDAAADMIRACLAGDLEAPLRARLKSLLPDTARDECPTEEAASKASSGVSSNTGLPRVGGDVSNTGLPGVGADVSNTDLPPVAGARSISAKDMHRAVRLASLAEFLKRQGRAARNGVNRDELAAHEAFVRAELAALQAIGGGA